jgi:hypothetical protein
MRSYVGVTSQELESLMQSQQLAISTLYAPTSEFMATHSELGEEEQEFILSMLAADESLELNNGGNGFVIAVEIPENKITASGADSIEISEPITLDWVACVFLVSPDGEDLTWFAIQEVSQHLPSWRS